MKKIFSNPGDRIVLVVLLVMLGLSVGASVLRSAAGLCLIRGEFYILLPVLMLLTGVGWGLSALYRRIKNRKIRLAVGALMGLGMVAMFAITMSYAMFAAGLTLPQRYSVVKSSAGRRLVVMRALDPDETRIAARHEARIAADPDASPDISAEDWGYTYTAYAMDPLGAFFYREKTLMEGEVHIGYASKAELMVEWEQDGTVGHFFVNNPEVADDGEMRARTD